MIKKNSIKWLFLICCFAPYNSIADQKKTIQPERPKSLLKLNFKKTQSANPHKASDNILLIHGLTSTKDTWTPVETFFSNFGNVWSIDLPGYGHSFSLPYEDLEQVEQSVKTFVLDAKLDNLTIVGHSMGAKLAVMLGNLFPKRLIIEDMEMIARKLPKKSKDLDIFSAGAANQEALTKALAVFDYYDGTIKKIVDSGMIFQEKGRYYSRINPLVDWWYQKNVTTNIKIGEHWKNISPNTPCLVLRASKNSSISDQGIAFMKKHHPKLQVELIPNSEHSIHRSNTKDFEKAISTFFLQ